MTAPAVTATFVLRSPAGATLLTIPSAGYEPATGPAVNRKRRRQVAQGSFNPGEVELSSVLDTGQLRLVVLITGTTWADSQNLYDALVAAAEQGPGGLVDVTYNTTTRTWTCTGSPDIEEEGSRQADVLRWSFKRLVTLTWPVHPYPA